MKKRFISMLLCFAVTFGTIPISTSAENSADIRIEKPTIEESTDIQNEIPVKNQASPAPSAGSKDDYTQTAANAAEISTHSVGTAYASSTDCSHSSFDNSGKCTGCGVQAAAGVTNLGNNPGACKWYLSLEDAFASVTAANNTSGTGKAINLMRDYTSDRDIPISGYIFFYAKNNKVKFTNGKSFVIKKGGTFACQDNVNIDAVTVESGGKFSTLLDFTIGTLTIRGGEISPTGTGDFCNFGKINIVDESKTLADIFPPHITYKHKGGDWVTEEELKGKSIENVIIYYAPLYYESISSTNKTPKLNDAGIAKTVITVTHSPLYSQYKDKLYHKWYRVEGNNDIEIEGGKNSDNGSELALEFNKAGVYTYKCVIEVEGFKRTLTETITVKSIESSYVKEPKAIDNLKYNGTEQALIEAGTVSTGQKILYSLDGTTWSEDIPKASRVGNYTVHYKVDADDVHSGIDSKTLNAVIGKAQAPQEKLGELKVVKRLAKTYTFNLNDLLGTPPAGCEYGKITYNNPDVDFIGYYDEFSQTAAIDENGILSLPIQNYNGNPVDGIVRVTVETDNYEDIYLTIEVSAINKIFPSGTPTLSRNWLTYGEALSVITLSGSMQGDDNEVVNGTFSWEEPSAKHAVGRHDVRWNFTPASEYYKYDTASGRIEITVRKADPVCVDAPDANILTYNGSEQELITPGSADGGTIVYSLDKNNWGTAVPKATQADSYTVFYKILGDDNHNDSAEMSIPVSIAQLPVIIEWSGTENLVYDGTQKTISANVSNKAQGDTVNITTGGTLTAAEGGTYTAEVTGVDNDNYTVNGGQNIVKEWSIAQAADNEITGLSISDWTYGDSAANPSAASKYGTPIYSYSPDENGTYTSNVPQDAGTYWVKAAVAGTGSYNGAESNPVSFTIAKRDISNAPYRIVFEPMTYSGSEQIPQAVVTADGFTVTGTCSGVTNVSDKTTFTANGNFSGTIADIDTNMAKKNISGAAVALAGQLTYNGEEQTQNVTVTLDGFTVTYDVSGNKAANVKTDGNYTLTVTGNGNFEGSQDIPWNIVPAEPVENPQRKTTATVPVSGTLASAAVTNGELLGVDGTTVLEGTFAWIDDTKIITTSSTEQMKFTPNDKNYSDIILNVAVSAYSSRRRRHTSSYSYTVKFETNGGSEIADVAVPKNSKVPEPTAPAKDGFEFAGWFTDKALKNKYTFASMATKSFTLYAAWNKIEAEPEPTDEPKNPDKTNLFDDVSKGDWYYDDVMTAVENGLFTGTGSKTFSPNDIITRGMFVTVLYRAEGEPAVNKSIPFEDVSKDSYYADAVIWAEQNELVSGVSETKFAPNDNITREQIAAIMFRFAEYKGYDVSQGGMRIREYDDYASISDYAAAAMTWAVNTGLMTGKTETTINPKDNATRAETAAILNRFLGTDK